ncbi:NAD(P)-dependent oxidoreductase [Agromyces laixinhei]|uniref:NAD(P)-dependent oxidoreductase n=1 Tax=Agromyces laixinhei TaxID=2585717 RepID=UPI0018DE91B0|nr:NAD(P)H-binding protein [Agromyces laixinhei]
MARDPRKLDDETELHRALTVIRGDVLDPASVDDVVAGADVVLSLFGHVKGSPPTLQADGTRNIVAAMTRHDVHRIVTLSGGGLRAVDRDRPKAADRVIRLLLKALAGHVLADAEAHLEVLRASDLDWTVVRGPRLVDAGGTGRYRVGWVGVDASTRISRDDLADFILTQVDDRTFVGEVPFVSD